MKKQFGIFAKPVPNAPMGKQMMHTATVLLFDRSGDFCGNDFARRQRRRCAREDEEAGRLKAWNSFCCGPLGRP